MTAAIHNEVTVFLREALAQLSDSAEAVRAEPDQPLDQLGIDSIKLIQLIVRIEERYQFTFAGDEMLFEHFGTIAAAADHIMRKLRAAT